jgi:hypothetical protein
MASDPLDIALDLNKALEQQQRLIRASNKELRDQLSLMHGIATAHDGQDFDAVLKHVTDVRQALEQVVDELEQSDDAAAQVNRSLKLFADRADDIGGVGAALRTGIGENILSITGATTGFVSGLTSGMGLITKSTSAAVGAVSSLGTGILSLGRSIISIPFKILGGLVDMATNMDGSTAFADAREAIRKDYGDFSEDLSKTTKRMYKGLRGELSNTGLTAFRVFGDMAERLTAMHELMKGMGNLASLFAQELRGAVDARTTEYVLAYQKALGISNEEMKEFALSAKVGGMSLTAMLNDTAKASTGMADAFGMSQKAISRDISEMTNDTANFGSMTVQQMGRASVYVRKLGLEIKEVLGVIAAYDNFEDAAMGAAHLAQAFGANVDALEMMREQDPTKRLDALRKSMAMAGVDSNKLSRQELKLLAQHTGLSEGTTKLAFALNNQGTSMEEIERQQARNEKRTLTHEEAMTRLAGSIERLNKSGSIQGGFLTNFVNGFEKGIKRYSEFRSVLRFIRQDLFIFKWLGIETGRMFVKLFPGVQQMIDGLTTFFNPRRFKQLRNDLSGIFNGLMSGDVDLKDGLTRMSALFKDFLFGPGGKQFAEGAYKFGSTVLKFMGKGIDFGLTYVEKAIHGIADFIRDPRAAIERLKSVASSSSNPIVKMLKPLWDALAKHWDPMVSAFTDLWDAVWPRVEKFIGGVAPKLVAGIFGVMFAPAVLQAAVGAVAGGIVKNVGSAITRVLGLGVDDGVRAASRSGTFAKAFDTFGHGFSTKFASSSTKFLRVAGPIGIAVGAALSVSEGLDMFFDRIDPKFDETTRKMAAAGAGVIHGFTFGLLPDDLEVTIANKLASLADMIFNGLTNVFGRQFVDSLKEYISPVIDLWGGLGDAIVALFKGDEAKFDEAFNSVILAAQSAIVNGLKFVVTDAVPMMINLTIKLVGGLGRALTKAVRMLWDSIGDITSNAVTAIFGEKLGRGVKLVFDFVGNIYDTLSTFVFDTVPSLFTGLVDWFSKLASNIWDAITGELSWSQVWSHFKTLGDRIVEPFEQLGPKLTKVWEGFGDSFRKVWNDAVTWFTGTIDDLKAGFDSVVSYISDPSNIVNDARSWGSGVADGISNGWNYITGGSSDNRLGTKMVTDVVSAANSEVQRSTPELARAFTGMFDSAMDAFRDPTAAIEGLKLKLNEAQMKVEADKLATGGLSLDDVSLYNNVKDMDPAEVRKHITKFKDEIVPLFVGGKDSLMGQVRHLADSVSDDDKIAIGKVAMVSGMAERLASLASASSKISAIGSGIDAINVQLGMEATAAALTSMVDGITAMAVSVTDEGALDVKSAQARIKGVTDVVEALVRQVNDVDSALDEVGKRPSDRINVKLKNLAKSLGVRGEKFEITHDKVKFYIQLDVRLDAEDIAHQIVKGDWFVLERGPKGPPRRSTK